jgi:purine-binding chemotaxis protein CheW
MPGQANHAEEIELLVFELAGARHAVALSAVREVVRAVFITPLPDAPPVVEGVIDVRGDIVPVYDLRARFGLPPRALDPAEWLILVWTGERPAALRCDAADWLKTVPATAVERGGEVLRGGRRLLGVARLADGLVLIHDLALFLDDAERDLLDAALARHAGDAGR